MAYAVETTHRTFKRLLEASSEAIGRTSTTAPRKRGRLTGRSVNPTQSIARSQKADTQNAREGQTFNPNDREAYRQRLHTFRDDVTLWNSKPDLIDTWKWCLKGWRCVDRDTVECVTCKERVMVNLDSEAPPGDNIHSNQDQGKDSPMDIVSYEQSFSLLISTAHTEFCPWRDVRCDPAINRVDVKGYDTVVHSLRDRFESLLEACTSDQIHLRVTLGNDIDLSIAFSRFCRKVYSDSSLAQPPETEDNNALLGLALNGWTPLSERFQSAPIIRCEACLANVGLWDYMDLALVESDKIIPEEKLLPANQMHYPDCPWINAEAQNPDLKLRGYSSKPRLSACQVLITYIGGATNDVEDSVAENALNIKATREARNQSLLKRAKKVRKAWDLKGGRRAIHGR